MQDYFRFRKCKEAHRSTHAPKISNANIISKPLKRWSTASNIVWIRRISKCTYYWNWSYSKRTKHNEYKYELKKVIQFYKEDLDECFLRSQLLTFSIIFQLTTEIDANINLQAVCIYLQELFPGMKLLLLQVMQLVKLVLVAAATNATSERSFSAMRRVKSYLQITMA